MKGEGARKRGGGEREARGEEIGPRDGGSLPFASLVPLALPPECSARRTPALPLRTSGGVALPITQAALFSYGTYGIRAELCASLVKMKQRDALKAFT